MHSFSRFTIAALILLSTVINAANKAPIPAHPQQPPITQNTQDDQETKSIKTRVFGLPGSSKRLFWYIGSGIMLIITATAIYWYYAGSPDTQTPGHNRQSTMDFESTSIAPTPGPESPMNNRTQEMLPITITVTEEGDESWATYEVDPKAAQKAFAQVRNLNVTQEGIIQVQQAFEAAVEKADIKALKELRSQTLPPNWRQTKSPRL